MLAVPAAGYEPTTLEGLAPAPGELRLIHDAFSETHRLHRGHSPPGRVLGANALLQKRVTPRREEIIEAISGIICRCPGYGQITGAIQFAAARRAIANPRRSGARGENPVVGAT